MKSMTGYGEASSQIRGTRVTVQVRSLNHRHLDLQLRAKNIFLSEEIRKVIRHLKKRRTFYQPLAGKGQSRARTRRRAAGILDRRAAGKESIS
jgi:uncharacterized protein YicC (UPF0701 family)